MNICEPTLNPVISKLPKMLIGNSQNGVWTGFGSEYYPNEDVAPPGESWHLTLCVNYVERGKPVFLPFWGKQTVRNAVRSAGIGGRKKRRPSHNRSDRS